MSLEPHPTHPSKGAYVELKSGRVFRPCYEATRARTAAAQCEAARAELAGAKLARDAMSNGAVDLDPSLRATVQGQINDKIARASELVAKLHVRSFFI